MDVHVRAQDARRCMVACIDTNAEVGDVGA